MGLNSHGSVFSWDVIFRSIEDSKAVVLKHSHVRDPRIDMHHTDYQKYPFYKLKMLMVVSSAIFKESIK